MNKYTLGFIGFGEAAFGIAKGLKEDGLEKICFFDKFYNQKPMGDLIIKRSEEVDVFLLKSTEDLAKHTKIIFSSVIAKVAIDVAKSISPYLTKDHIYIDSNAASPVVKKEIARIIEEKGSKFVDAALMGPIPTFLHRVPILASGSGAADLKKLMSPYGMKITYLGNEPGQASAIKMFRSIFMKGFVTLLLETLVAADKYNADDIVLDSIAETMDKNEFKETARLLVTRGVIHAERRAFEMNEVIRTLEDIGVSSIMSDATQKKLQWCSELNLKNYFKGEPPEDIKEVLLGLKDMGV